MKLIFASDIHGSATYCEQLFERIADENPDLIVLLGDLLYHGPRNDLPLGYDPKRVVSLLNSAKDRIIAVRGNCDSEVDQMVLDFPCMADYSTILLERNIAFFITHGHVFKPEDAKDLAASQAFISGHTHIKQAETIEGCFMLNPGSISLPKDGSRSFAIYDEGTFLLKTLEGSIIDTVRPFDDLLFE